jgi:hypothetical protein
VPPAKLATELTWPLKLAVEAGSPPPQLANSKTAGSKLNFCHIGLEIDKVITIILN